MGAGRSRTQRTERIPLLSLFEKPDFGLRLNSKTRLEFRSSGTDLLQTSAVQQLQHSRPLKICAPCASV